MATKTITSAQNHGFTSPLRYPGGKGALANFMKVIVSQNDLLDGDYTEVYAGGAGIAWTLLLEEYVRRVHINDLNKPLMAFWCCVVEFTDELCKLIRDTPVTIEEWHRQRGIQEHFEEYSTLELGFSTFFLNRTNRSGILKGGVIGGKGQLGKWKLDARFNRTDLIRRIQRIGQYSSRIKLYNLDAVCFIREILPELPQGNLVYLDPPYYKKGQDLYENHYQPHDHRLIADLVTHQIKQPWLVSYDAVPEVINLYSGQEHLLYRISYSAQDRYAGEEVIIYNRLKVPHVSNPATAKIPALQRSLL